MKLKPYIVFQACSVDWGGQGSSGVLDSFDTLPQALEACRTQYKQAGDVEILDTIERVWIDPNELIL